MAVDHATRIHSVELEIGGRTMTLETGRVAEQAHGAVMVRFGDTMVLGAVVGERQPNESVDFFPLTVDYEERMYAAGKIPGGFIKREGRPTEAAILAARLTDRPLRPLFPKGYRSEVQIINTVMSADQENDPDILSIVAASAALTISPIPFDGPVGAVRVGLVGGEVVVNPTVADLAESELDAVVAGTERAIMMVEGEANQVPEETLLAAFAAAHEEIKRIVAAQRELQALAGKEKWPFTPPQRDEALAAAVREVAGDQLRQAVRNPDKVVRLEGTSELKRSVFDHFSARDGEEATYAPKDVSAAFEALLKEEVRSGILSEGIRPDGRRPDEVRPIWCEVGYLPRTHGSAIFTRGQTQVITSVTLGSMAEEQRLDSISPVDRKRYIHHYNFPPFSVGEVRRLRGASRRDIGHGALAERALLAVIPPEDVFPYTLRLVSEVVSSNGSTSMGSVSGSTLALMDAGVPITAPVAGVAMGLVTGGEDGSFTVLTDIQGMEDALGDMDFKVAGTAEGVTAIQMDIKVQGITTEVMRQALEQAHAGRQHILGKMLETIAAPRGELSRFAPLVRLLKINPEKIGALIGPGGKMIRSIQEETSTKIDVQDDGSVAVSSADAEGVERAVARIQALTQEFKIDRGDRFTGRVVTIMPFGAFVELVPGKDGLVHISELSEDPSIRVNRVEDVVNVGDTLEVMVTDVAPNGKVSLSRRAAITGELPEPKGERPSGPRRDGPGGGGFGGPRREGLGPMDRPMAPRDGAPAGMRSDGPGGNAPRPAPRPMAPQDDAPLSGRPADSRRRPTFGGDS
ncbi:MAG: Polyribonucleotide nucleotidyltransferase [uncultured Thermomicrobiales bacterium]|uniref:Polyribonucleotide nucleotidyltransferase n=1 Tax=uncultured Thermomicrobiales bacterium TaxID=1645740 RepID=A0A6J4U8Q9_9BACT|nr:MAG: Polyribonucleotide nucleotidyltransferase [uncultured Thermomicrobiales bacterium]